MLVGIAAVVAAVLVSRGGFTAALAGLASVSDAGVSSVPGVFASFFGPDPLNLLGVVILTSLGTWGLPQMVQKFYAIKSEESIKKGTIISSLFAVVVAGGCYFLGGFGRLFSDVIETVNGVPVGGYDAVIPAMLSSLPDLLIAVVVVLVLSASMSTLSSLVIASSSTITLDFLKGNLVKKMSEKTQVLLMRVFIVVFVAISAVIAIYQQNTTSNFIAQLMGVSWGALAGAFLAPFLYGLYWKRTTKAACWVSFGFGSAVMVANMLARSAFPAILQSPINCGAFAMLAGLVLVPAVSLVTPKPDRAFVDEAFACYDKKVPVSQKRALID
jgi:SSS family solute:Na+ symporter